MNLETKMKMFKQSQSFSQKSFYQVDKLLFIVYRKKFSLKSLKARYWIRYYLLFSFVMRFIFLMILKFQIMQMTRYSTKKNHEVAIISSKYHATELLFF